MVSDPVIIDDEDADTAPVVIIDDDEDVVATNIVKQVQTPIDTIILDNEPITKSDALIVNKVITSDKKEKRKKRKVNPYFVISLKNNKLMDKIITKCLSMEQNVGMARVIEKTLIPLYKDVDVSFKQSELFRKLLKKTFKLLVRDPDHKFLHIKTLCDEIKSGTFRRKVPFVTLSTNLKHNGPDYGKEITISSKPSKKNAGVNDKSGTVPGQNKELENNCDVVIIENSDISTDSDDQRFSLEGNKNTDGNIVTIEIDKTANIENSKKNHTVSGIHSNKFSPTANKKKKNNNRYSPKNKKQSAGITNLSPANNDVVETNVCKQKTDNFITVEVPQKSNSAKSEENTVINKSAQENINFVSITSVSDNEINDTHTPENRKLKKRKSNTEMYSCHDREHMESNNQSSFTKGNNDGFGLENTVNRMGNFTNSENRLNLEIDALKGIIRINTVATGNQHGLINSTNEGNKVNHNKLSMVKNNKSTFFKKQSFKNLKEINRFASDEKTVINQSAQKNMSFMSIISETDNETNIYNNIPENSRTKRRKCETEDNQSSTSHSHAEKTDVIELIDSENESMVISHDGKNRNGVTIIEKAENGDNSNKENHMLKNADAELSHTSYDDGLLIPQNQVEVILDDINQVSLCDVSKETKVAELEEVIMAYKQKIAILEKKEVTSDYPFTSPYLRCCAYKKKIVAYYKMICDVVGDCEDLVKRREIRLHVTEGHPPGPAKMLEQYLNKSIDSTGTVPFPDFADVVKCVIKANVKEKLGWKKSRIVQEAAALFRQCGEALRKRRQKREYRDLLSLVQDAENTGDPAETDPELFAKLEANKQIAKINEEQVLQRYVNMESGCNIDTRLDMQVSEDSNFSDTDSDNDEHKNALDERESSNNNANTSEPNNEDLGVVIESNICVQNSPGLNVETPVTGKSSINYESTLSDKDGDIKNNVPIESSCVENNIILTTTDNQDASASNETISVTNYGVFENIRKDCTENCSLNENVCQSNDFETEVNIKKEVKLESIDVQCMLDELGDSYVSTVFDIEDPFLVIEISSDGFSDEDL